MQKKRAKEDFEKAAEQSLSIAGMCRYFGLTPSGGNYRIMHNAILKYSIDIRHFTGQGWNTDLKFRPFKEKPLNEILTEDSSYQSHKLKRRLLPKASKATSASLVDYLNGKADQYLLNYTIKTATIETIDETT